MSLVNIQEWKAFFESCPDAHILQSSAWGELKNQFGWETERLVTGNLGAQVLFQALPLGYSIAYIPRGPVSCASLPPQEADWQKFLTAVDQVCKSRNAILLKLEPDLWLGERGEFPWSGFVPSAHAIQPPRTIVVDLDRSEDEILGGMKSKTRYNIRLAARKDVKVKELESVNPFYQMLEKTADRSEFGIHHRDYYRKVYDLFEAQNACRLFLAEYQDIPLASIMVFQRGSRSWYFYGASAPVHRDRMPTYLVQWEAMRWARNQGCTSYDLWGVPDHSQEVLEEQFLDRHDGLWGVYRFKRGFGGLLKRTAGPWDRVYKPVLYKAYQARNWLNNRGNN